MRLTKFADYTLRTLMYAAAHSDARVTVNEVASVFDISSSHAKKVVRHLIAIGLLEGIRGRSGGFRLAVSAAEIRLGEVLRKSEPDFGLVECMLPKGRCVIAGSCRLPAISDRALRAFLEVYDDYTLADLLLPRSAFACEATTAGKKAI